MEDVNYWVWNKLITFRRPNPELYMHSQESEIIHVYTVATTTRMPVSLEQNSVVNVQSSMYKGRMPDTKWSLFIRWRPTFKYVTHAKKTLKHAAVSVGEAQVLKSFSDSFVALRLESTKSARGSGMKLHLFWRILCDPDSSTECRLVQNTSIITLPAKIKLIILYLVEVM
jgi:hypothetical protein